MLKKILIAFLPLGTIAVVVWLVMPEYGRLGEAKVIRDQVKAQLEEKKEFIAKVNRLQKQYHEVEDIAEKVAQIIPPEPDIPNLLAEIPAIALQQGMSLDNLQFNLREGADSSIGNTLPYKTMDANFSVKGTYEDLKSFLKALEKELRMIDVQNIQFSTPQGGENTDLYTFSVTVRMYFGLKT